MAQGKIEIHQTSSKMAMSAVIAIFSDESG